MFPWSIAKSAEAMFSRWAVRRVCKFVLKKKLGQFLLGDIDIDQLDVQLTRGTIQLNDLALNVDYLNEKLGAVASLIIKEGSIGSLLVKMPWSGEGFTVEVDELELVLVPGKEYYTPAVAETHHSGQDEQLHQDLGKLDQDMMDNASKSTIGDVHEGVKAIAKFVKLFLTSFNVKINKLIVAFDPCLEKDGNSLGSHRTLVLRISSIECGTHLSDDANSKGEAESESFFGMSRLTNYVKFQGAILELLQLDDGDKESSFPCLPSQSIRTPIMTGKGGGFSGNLKLSIPWKNGSLDIRRVDSDVSFDPIELQFQPSTIKWLLHSVEAFRNLEKDRSDCMLHKAAESCHHTSAPYSISPQSASVAISTSKTIPVCGGSSNKLSSLTVQDLCDDTLQTGPHLISDWVPLSTIHNKNVGIEEELDFGASVDQFFECFDGMRSSQSALGNSGMWNWTCSVFSAITAASSLASGSLHIPSEQQHIETNVKANFAGVSVFLSFQDEDKKFMFKGYQINSGSYIPYLGAECRDILLSMQVSPQEIRYEGFVKSIEIANYLSHKGDNLEIGTKGPIENISSQNLYIQQLQANVQGALPLLAPLAEDSHELTSSTAKNFPFGKEHNVVKIPLLTTAGVTHCRFTTKLSSQDGNRERPVASFEVELAPFVFWVDFSLINMLSELVTEILESVEKGDEFSSKAFHRNDGLTLGEVKRGSSSCVKTLSSTQSLAGNILMTSARVILCFPFKSDKDVRSFASWDQFVALDFHLPSSGGGGLVRESGPTSDAAKQKSYSSTATHSIHLKISSLDIFLVTPIVNGLGLASDEFSVKDVSSVSQTSIFLDCSALDILISPEVKENIRGSIQSELPGSWHHLKLKIRKFELLSVSNIGGIRGAKFFWLGHAEGKLWGSITGVPNQEFLLILCNNSTMKRGDGGGSNALSSRLAGSDIIHLWDPESFHDFTSISLRCATLIAVGGRLDWLDAISSFFSVPSANNENPANDCMQKGKLDVSSGSSFILSFVDIGLSYEPYVMNLVVKSKVLDPDSRSSNAKQEISAENVACLLAASSLNISNLTLADSIEKEFKISVHDIGLLIHVVLEPENVSGNYNAEWLQKTGYVKVAREALFEAILRTNCKSGLLWEVECSKSHVFMETCNDTTSSLISLAAQLQKLFAPDMEESVVHLQNRWNRVQQEQDGEDLTRAAGFCTRDSLPLTSEMNSSSQAVKSEPGLVGLMNEICDDAFQIDDNQISQYDSSESKIYVSVDENLIGELGTCIDGPEFFSHGLHFDESVPVVGFESSQTSSSLESDFPEFIELYCSSEVQPVTELSVGGPSHKIHKGSSSGAYGVDSGTGSSGWYEKAPLKIVEDHISELRSECSIQKFEGTKFPYTDNTEAQGFRKAIGCVLLKNIDVRWRMVAGCDWKDCKGNDQKSTNNGGRNATVCLELSLSGMEFQYEIFPVGGIHVSKLSLSVQEIHLYDLSRDAPWKLVLGYYQSKDHPRKSSSKAFKLDLEAVRPDPLIPLEEYRLRIAFLPMLLHLHQSQLDFFISFFGAKSSSVDQSPSCRQDSDSSKSLTSNNLAQHNIAEEAFLPYFQSFDIWPLLVRVDYSPCRVDLAALSGGNYAELVNLVPWKGVELQLKHVHGIGIYGWGSVCETIIGEWLEDISQNQIHKVFRGLPPIRSVVALGAGAAKLVSLPVESYRKDKRVIKGIQRGITAFIRSISVEAVGLGVHLAAGAHDILLQAEYRLTNSDPSIPRAVSSKMKENVRSNQPKDAQQGIQQAYESLSNGLEKSASALVGTPFKKYLRGAGAGSALAAAVRAVPAAAIAPASACAGAVHYTFLGFRNSLDPERKKESIEKYLGPNQPWEQN
uniref:Autophagy-related protein 2 n=1 Tax=Cannabis sativa TaxID=3483 RepID=A0A803NKV6_CANSA